MKFGTDIHVSQRMNPNGFWKSPNFSSRATMRLTFVVLSEMSQQWIVMKCGSGTHVPFRMSCNNFGDPFAFHLVFLL